MITQNQKKRKVFLGIRKSRSFLNLRHSWQDLHPAHAFPGFNTQRYMPGSFISPIELAATHDWSISSATRLLRECRTGYPSSELILKCLRDVSPAIMEDFINNLLKSSYNNLSNKLRNDIEKKGIFILDFHVDPYYGNNDNPDIKKEPLKHSTNKGYTFLTADIHLDKFNFTIAAIHRPPGAKIYDLFLRLYERVSHLLKPNLIIMDGEFPTVRVLRKLTEMNVPCIARKIMTRRVKTSLAHYKMVEPRNWQRRWHRVDLRDTWIRKLTVPIEVTTQLLNGKVKALMKTPFLDITPKQADKLYKLGFSIETGYRDKHLFQPRTYSVNLSTRLFLFLIAIYLWNIWQIFRYQERLSEFMNSAFGVPFMQSRTLRLKLLLNIFS